MQCVQCGQQKYRKAFPLAHVHVCAVCLRLPVLATRKGGRVRCAVCAVSYEHLFVYGNTVGQRVAVLLCRLCNLGLEAFRDDPTLLLRAAALLTEGRDDSITIRAHLAERGTPVVHRSSHPEGGPPAPDVGEEPAND